jgi:hypothetical protein
MAIEDAIKTRIVHLLGESKYLVRSDIDSDGAAFDTEQCQDCLAWLASAQNVVHLICDSSEAPYRMRADKIADKEHGWLINSAVGKLAALLKNLLLDAEAGLIASVADRARAETFDDFLDHADAYFADGRKNESGVIAGVVFEDTLRRICRKEGIVEKDVKLDMLISSLTSRGELSSTKAKRARVAAHVRTKASHAQWDEFELEDVRAAIEFTREIIAAKLDS